MGIGRGSAPPLAGPLAAAAFALGLCPPRAAAEGRLCHFNRAAQAGAAQAGAAPAIHIGQRARVKFRGLAELMCRAVPAARYR
jgi:hypothetical protein